VSVPLTFTNHDFRERRGTDIADLVSCTRRRRCAHMSISRTKSYGTASRSAVNDLLAFTPSASVAAAAPTSLIRLSAPAAAARA
jgi:hypothetical protein